MARLTIPLIVACLAVLVDCNDMLKLIPQESLKYKAISANYTPQGNIINIANMPVYQFQPPWNVNDRRMLVAVYDIYGFAYPNMMQITDHMASQRGGFRAVLPDFFRGDYWYPERDPSELPAWQERVGNWNVTVRTDLINIVRFYERIGVKEFAIFGIGWGGKIATIVAKDLQDLFKASALIHPSSVTNDEAAEVDIPMFLMPTQNDPDMLPFYEVLRRKFGDNSGHRRFDDMTHGFLGALSNFGDPSIQIRVNEVITTLGGFFDRNLNETKQGEEYFGENIEANIQEIDENNAQNLLGHWVIITLFTLILIIFIILLLFYFLFRQRLLAITDFIHKNI